MRKLGKFTWVLKHPDCVQAGFPVTWSTGSHRPNLVITNEKYFQFRLCKMKQIVPGAHCMATYRFSIRDQKKVGGQNVFTHLTMIRAGHGIFL